MKTYELTFWRGNPQSRNGGYETTRIVEAKNNKELERKIKNLENNVAYGTMECIEVKEIHNEIG